MKLIYPDGEFTKKNWKKFCDFAGDAPRVKEQLKKLGGMEFYDVNFSYIDNETFEEKYVSVPEQGGGKLIPEGMCNPGQVYTVFLAAKVRYDWCIPSGKSDAARQRQV